MISWNDRSHSPIQMEHHERELDALHSIACVLSTQSGPRAMLTRVLQILERDLTMARGTILLLSLDGSELLVEAATELHTDAQREVRYRRGEGIVGRVIETGEPAVIPSISDEPEFLDRIHRRKEFGGDALSFVCVPIVLGSEVVGTLSVDLPYRSGEWLHEALRILNIVASMIANDVKARRSAAAERRSYETENLRLRSALGEQFRPDRLVGNGAAMKTVYQRIYQVADSESPVLVRGEVGTGKATVAAAVHYAGPKAAHPFTVMNCTGLSANLIEYELFGREKGITQAPAGAGAGRIAEAEGGTLYLSDVADLPMGVQGRLLSLLQEQVYEPVGSGVVRTGHVRLIAGTSRDLEYLVDRGLFRKDLYYRLCAFPMVLPPLRERREDVPLLADHFAGLYACKCNRPVSRISTMAINMLMAYHWPGNVRELESCIEFAVLAANDGVLYGHSLPPTLQMPTEEEGARWGTLKSRIQLLERDMVTDALKRHHGNVTSAARELGITPRMVRYKIQSLKIPDLQTFRQR